MLKRSRKYRWAITRGRWFSWISGLPGVVPAENHCRLNDIRNKYASRGFEVIAVNVDENPDGGLEFLREYPVNHPVAYDPKGTVPSIYKLKGMPYAFLIDRKGIVHHVHESYRDGDRNKIENMVKALLEK